MHLLGVQEVVEQGILIPDNALVYISGRVGIAFRLSSMTAEETKAHICQHISPYLSVFASSSPMQIGSDFVRTLSLYGMTLRTARLEEIGTLLVVTRRVRHFERYLCSQAEKQKNK